MKTESRKRGLYAVRLLLMLVVMISFMQHMPGAAAAAEAGTAVTSAPGKWKKAKNGKYRYKFADGSHAVSTWIRSGGKTYYVNKKGYRLTGMKKVGKIYYYFSKK